MNDEEKNKDTFHSNIVIDTTTISDVATTRKKYRTGNNPTSVKVYTIAQESRYLIVSNVPVLGITKELIELFALYGPIEEYRFLDEHDNSNSYFDTYWIKFKNISQARFAKRKLNKYVFYGSTLKVEYSPESENEEDIKIKMQDRIQSVLKRLDTLKKQSRQPQKEKEISINKRKPNLRNFYNQPLPIKSNKNEILSKPSYNSNNFISGNNNKKRIHLLSNAHNNNNAFNSSNNKKQRRRI
ncbi:hypothetical protein BCR36DRAFT_406495 [Piromyces finnis]|uniref:RNA-binding protein 48 n=1 Tax=Piromyces finnis TaxID=1754191 RepID=A0A1Y1V1S6_9FUNG|nr:hypothetical protein BCR36DRAFT_406495 [Piromyces finnis]|eukprot:ORX44138.1 hypothetical protein BCR36DRAFT_406495 [Piromyces finnis]